MSRRLAAGVNRMIDTLVHEEHVTRDHLEMLVAIELLRATPRFWSGAMLWISANDFDGDGYLLTILCNDGYPAHANVTNRLFERSCNLMVFMEEHYGDHYTDVLVGAAWVSPRTWQYETRCWRRA
jgi:hypothetical protein